MNILRANKLQVLNRLYGYVINRIEEVPELCLTAYLLKHEKTGAEHVHLARNDNENAFGVLFRTTPTDSTGVPHILEHLALCGSNKYPCRDPFMKMLFRSLATYMNAHTGPDATFYPFATQNIKDYYNLMSIYLDATFYPLLKPTDFRQEGWRLEHENVNDPKSPIIFKGVVFNEMKGVFSSQASLYYRSLQNHLFPSNTYSHESGGDPLCIPDLAYEQLKQFYQRCYHPSNSKFYTYGNFPLESHLAFINDNYLSKFNADYEIKKSTYVPDQPKWTSPKQVSIECQNDPLAPFPNKQTTVSVTYLLENINNTEEIFTLSILSLLLADGPNAPFYQALVESGIGSDYSPSTGFSGDLKQASFSVGLQGISKDDVELVESIILRTLNEAANEGFADERIEAILHRIELSTKHQIKNFGLNIMFGLYGYLTHDGDSIKGLHVNEHVEQFRRNLKADKNYLKKKIREHFINNSHRLTLIMSPSDGYEEKLKQKEKEKLNEKLSKLTEQDKETIFKDGIELVKEQEKAQDSSLLPTLNVQNDIPKIIEFVDVEHLNIHGVPVQTCAQPTNTIIYFNAIANLDTNNLPHHLIPYLPLFSRVITKLGAGSMDRKQFDQEKLLRTGGLSVGVHSTLNPVNEKIFEKGLSFHSHCLERNHEQMINLWKDIFKGVRFDDDYDYLLQLIKMSSAEMAMSVSHHGHKYAMCRASSSLHSLSNFNELTGGLVSLSNIRKEAAKESAKEVVDHLKSIASIAFRQNRLRIAINAEQHNISPALKHVERLIQSIPVNPSDPVVVQENNDLNSKPLKEHHVFPFANNYLSKAQYCVPFSHPDYAKLKIASRLVTNRFLLREVREKGGAYGGGASFSLNGIYYFYSYRDPNTESTLETFNRAVDWMKNGKNYSDQDIDEAKLSTFQEVDEPIPPGRKGMGIFTRGITYQMKQDYRVKLLNVTKNDIADVALRYLVNPISGTVLIGPKFESTANQSSKWKVIEEKQSD